MAPALASPEGRTPQGRFLRLVRTARGLTQYDVADAIGCSQALYTLMENRHRPAGEYAEALAQVLDVPVELIEGKVPWRLDWRDGGKSVTVRAA